MPLMNSTGALKIQNIDLGYKQYIVVTSGNGSDFYPTETGNAYITPFSDRASILKVDNNGNVIYNRLSNSVGTSRFFSSSDTDMYVGGASGNNPYLGKYYSSGASLIWSYKTSQLLNGTGGTKLITNDITGNIYTIQVGIVSSVVHSTLVKYDNSGTILFQKEVLTPTSYVNAMYYDTVNNKLLIAGTNQSSPTKTYLGIYDPNNGTITPSNTLLVQSSVTNNYSVIDSGLVSDGTYSYQLIQRTVSGTNYYVYVKTNQTTGSNSYSYSLSIGGNIVELRSIAQDTNYLYIIGVYSGTLGYVAQINKSDGSISWGIKLNSTTTNINSLYSIKYRDNFLYVSLQLSTGVLNFIKIRSNGRINGTYASMTFTPTIASLTSINSDSTSTTTDNQTVTTYTNSSITLSYVNNTGTVTTTAIP
jgi:hypothetical protein